MVYSIEMQIIITYTDKQCYNDKHCCEVDSYNSLKIFVFVKICAIADDSKYNGRNNYVEDNSKDLPWQNYLYVNILDTIYIKFVTDLVFLTGISAYPRLMDMYRRWGRCKIYLHD